MPWSFKQILEVVAKKEAYSLLKNSSHGLEIERLRVGMDGSFSQSPHPKGLGKALTNPFITTDFSESQIELITPPFIQEKRVLEFLRELTIYTSQNIGPELLWPLSVPTRLPKKDYEIPLARYGKSLTGRKKTLYRNGLGLRYGRKMQTVSGIHYNFSFSEEFWDLLYKKYGKKQDKKQFKTESYFKMLRNFRRFGWINTYLFGATPAIDKSYLRKKSRKLKKLGKDTYYGKYATSLRMSEFGYYSKVQAQLAISFNSLEEYRADLKRATTTVKPKYKKLGEQLNANILQLENEFYATIRPKQTTTEDGVDYLEIRSVDNDPYNPTGVHRGQLCFLNLLSIYCLLKESPPLDKDEHQEVNENQMKVALNGRNKNLKLRRNEKKIKMRGWAEEIFEELAPIAKSLDKNFTESHYVKNLARQKAKLEDPELTPSAIILADIKKQKSLLEFGLNLAKKHKKALKAEKIPKNLQKKFDEARDQSFLDQKRIEFESEYYTEGYKDMEVSTQLVIREALKRKIKVEVLDRKASFIRLKKGKKIEYIKQATKTSRDSYMTYLIMESKTVTKQIMEENDISVPRGRTYYNAEAAIEDYAYFSEMHVVVKPNSTNYGIGIAFIDPGEKKKFGDKVREAFEHDDEVIVEEYIKGAEYRFLVMGKKVVGVIRRDPANVTGDGKHTIKELADLRNKHEKNIYKMRIGKVEKEELRKQNLSVKTIPKKGKVIYLRKNSNVSTGGDAIDITDKMPELYKKIALQSAALVNAKICGVDMIMKSLKADSYAIIELNFNPALEMHAFPFKGEKQEVGSAVLDFLGF